MLVGTILLTRANKYVDNEGNLPKRPKHDKELLTSLLRAEGAVSNTGYEMLPLSIQKHVIVTEDNVDYAPVTIDEIAESDLLIISRATEELESGKPFRLDNFRCLVKDRKVELWISIK